MKNNGDLRILLVGDDTHEMYVKAFYNGMKQMGYVSTKLFAINKCIFPKTRIGKLLYRVETRLAAGPHICKVNGLLRTCIKEFNPNLVFVYSTRIIDRKTIDFIKNMKCVLFAYNNDDPFTNSYHSYFWRKYINLLKRADVGFVYRKKNVEECIKIGCQNVEILRAYYLEERNFPKQVSVSNVPAVVFLGHYENDERQEYICELLNEGIAVGIPEITWEAFNPNNELLIKLKDSHNNYNDLMNSCKIALVFLSKINSDEYTRRCFEIPATKKLMIAPYTEELAAMFVENKEAVFYRNKTEFVEKVRYYLEHDEERELIAEAGYERLMTDGHEVRDRIRHVMKCYEEIVAKNHL